MYLKQSSRVSSLSVVDQSSGSVSVRFPSALITVANYVRIQILLCTSCLPEKKVCIPEFLAEAPRLTLAGSK